MSEEKQEASQEHLQYESIECAVPCREVWLGYVEGDLENFPTQISQEIGTSARKVDFYLSGNILGTMIGHI